MGELVITDGKGIETKLQEAEIKKYIAANLNEQEFWLFLNTARMFGLNPIKREIYPIKFGNKLQIVTGYQVYVERASRSGLLEYWNVVIEKPDPKNPETWRGVFTGKRKDWTKEFTWEVPMSEINKNNPQVHLMPEFFLKKNTLSPGLRMMIPEILSGMPYTSEEVSSGVSEDLAEPLPEVEMIEPSEEEQKHLAEEKQKALANIKTKIDSLETIEAIDKWYSGSKKLQESLMKTDILKMIEDRKKALTPKIEKPEGKSRAERIAEIEEKQKESAVKLKALSGYQAKITTFETLESLEKWAKILNIEKHPFKDDINGMIEIHRRGLSGSAPVKAIEKPESQVKNRAERIAEIVELTSKPLSDIQAYVTDEMLVSGVVPAILNNEPGALDEFNENLAEWLTLQNEPETENIPE